MEFKKMEAADYEMIKPYFSLRPGNCCEAHFAYHLIWRFYYDTRYYADEKGVLWLQRIDQFPAAALMPVSTLEEMKGNFKRLQEYFTHTLQEKMRMFLVDEEALKAIAPDPERYMVVQDTDSSDYIYDGEKMRTYSGRKYHQKKNFVNRFQKEYAGRFQYIRLHGEDREEIMEFLNRWVEEKESKDEFNRIESEELGISHIMEYEKEGEISMGGIRIDGRLEAFSIGSCDARRETAVIHVEKANPSVSGLYPYMAMEFLRQEFPDVPWINREDDMGFEELRKSKESYHPVFKTKKYIIIEK